MTKETYKFPTQQDLNAVDLTWKRYLLPPIHPEGLKIIAVIAAAVVILGLLSSAVWIVGLPLIVFAFYFFRNPARVTPQNDGYIMSPADGIVSNIKEVIPPKDLDIGDEALIRISIFMSVFSVHVNRAPVSGTVHKLKYRPGKFVSVAEKDSEDNERQEISMVATNGKKVGFIQIAGLVARRIYCPLKVSEKLKAGQVFGMIRFGSRLDVFLPKGVYPKVLLGQIAVAGETVLADMSQKTNAPELTAEKKIDFRKTSPKMKARKTASKKVK
ncbi:MAG: phosphatidylserine decarboxylase [Lactobacillales bacterium]|jgi:phosphatidylserine decarboxylase|nr:phosphatidylserine decarboxylase [Lactobacillales bacterium]